MITRILPVEDDPEEDFLAFYTTANLVAAPLAALISYSSIGTRSGP